VACLAAPASAGMPFPPGGPDLPPGSVQTPLGRGTRLYGMPVDVRLLDMPVPVSQAISMLAARYPVLSDLGVYAGQAVLSGQAAGRFWVAVLEPAGPRRTRGSLSVLATAAGAGAVRRPGWLPANARLRLDFDIDDDGRPSTQQIWTLALPVASAWRVVAEGLRREGWRADPVASDPAKSAVGRWARGRTRLQVTIAAADGGSGILLQQQDEATP